jgi:hypothetical protein
MALQIVDLPDPLSPTRATVLPAGTSKLTFFRIGTTRPPDENWTVRFWMRRAVSTSVCASIRESSCDQVCPGGVGNEGTGVSGFTPANGHQLGELFKPVFNDE